MPSRPARQRLRAGAAGLSCRANGIECQGRPSVSVVVARGRRKLRLSLTNLSAAAISAGMTEKLPVTLADIQSASRAIADAIVRTPTRHSRTLSGIAGCEVWLKFENRQFTASFKERGALNFLLALDEKSRARGVVAMSAGNHAQGVAYHAGRLGVPAVIVMPVYTPFNKVKHTRDFGAEVILQGTDLAAANTAARALAAERGLTFIHPYDDAKVIAGQGTIGLEMLEDVPHLDTLVVPVGGGGLISGVAVAAKARKPTATTVKRTMARPARKAARTRNVGRGGATPRRTTKRRSS